MYNDHPSSYEMQEPNLSLPKPVMLRPDNQMEERSLPITQPIKSAAEVQAWLGLEEWSNHELLGIVEVPLKSGKDTSDVITERLYIFQSTAPGLPLYDCQKSRPDNVSRITLQHEVTIIDEVSLEILGGGDYNAASTSPYHEVVLQPGREQTFGRGMEGFGNKWDKDTAPSLSRHHFKVAIESQSGQVTIEGQSSNGTLLTAIPVSPQSMGQPAELMPSSNRQEELTRLTDLHVEYATVASPDHDLDGINHDAFGSAHTPRYRQTSVVVVDGVSASNRPHAITSEAAQELANRSVTGQDLLKGLSEVLTPIYDQHMEQWQHGVLQRRTDADARQQSDRSYQRDRQKAGGEFTFVAATFNEDDDTVTISTPITSRDGHSVTGDSCALLVRDNHLYGFPITNSSRFNSPDALHPATVLVSPPTSGKRELSASEVESVTFTRQRGDTLIVATDGLAEWIIGQYENGNYSELNQMLAMSSKDFAAYAAEVREGDLSGSMRDDITYVKISDGEASIHREDGSRQRVRPLQELAKTDTKHS